ncbi:MAG: energy transducer TonB [Pseudomonadota bacterium]|nr:energy transducer TonB [Pseudomonadota bacterium]
MAYTDQQMSGNRITALVIVALIHIFLGYALITGLAYSAAQQIIKKVTTVDIKKEEPKKPPPPPPKPKNLPPPPVAPPVKINVAVTPPQIQTVITPPPPAPVITLPPPPAAPPPPRFTAKNATPRGAPQDWVTSDDYPPRALREERAGTTGFRLTIGPDGRPTDCEITSSSGSPDLDETACSLLKRRGKFAAATDTDGKPTTGYYTSRFKWVVPKD